MSIKYKFVLRSDHKNAKGEHSLVLQAFVAKKRIRVGLALNLTPKEYDPVKQQAKIPSDKQREFRVNAILSKIRSRLDDLVFEARMAGKSVSIDDLLDAIQHKPTSESFIDFMRAEIEHEKSDRTPSTVKQYHSTMKHLVAFKSNIYFGDLTFDFAQNFDRFLKKKGIEVNARAKYHTIVRKFILLAKKKKKRVDNPYEEFKVRSLPVERVWLSVEEVASLTQAYKTQIMAPILHKVLRGFLFQVLTSLRVSDLRLIKHDDIVGDTLVFSPQKTKSIRKVVKIPLSALAKQLIAEGGGTKGAIFDLPADATINSCLKEVAAAVGIQKRITTHVGRHTFAFLYLLLGGKIEELREIMGHSKMETTQIYTHTDNDKKVAGMLKFDEIFTIT